MPSTPERTPARTQTERTPARTGGRTDVPVVDWLFRNRETGEITVAQLPNAPLIVFLVAFLTRMVLHPTGTVGTVVDVVATAGLVVWAVLEVGWGVNPFRRILGGLVLLGQLVLLALR